MSEPLSKWMADLIYDTWTGDPKHYDTYAMEQSVKVRDALLASGRLLTKDEAMRYAYEHADIGPIVTTVRQADRPRFPRESLDSWVQGTESEARSLLAAVLGVGDTDE